MAQKKSAKKAAKSARPAKKAAKKPAKNAAKGAATKAAARVGPRAKSSATDPAPGAASARITAHIQELGDWRGERFAEIRKLIHDAVPAVVEELKWVKPSNPMGVPVWSQDGMICTGETYKDKLKFTFAHGAALPDPERVFNASLDGGTRRAIDLHEGDKLDETAFKALVRAAATLNARS